MSDRPEPLPRDGVYRAILLVLMVTILSGAVFALLGEYVWASEAAKNVGVGVVLVSGLIYFFFRMLGRREAKRQFDEKRRRELLGVQEDDPDSS